MKELRIGLPGQSYFLAKVQKALPHATVVGINSYRDFYEGNKHNLDAVLTSAEGGSAWTLLYPGYQVVVPKPRIIYQPLAYPIAGRDQEMVNFMNRWIELKKKDKTIEQTYNYWILGKGVILKAPRWSIIRNVLHWVE